MATPEGRVKSRIKKILEARKPFIYYDMPVPNGYGKSSLDFVGCFFGFYFAIEAKRAKKVPTDRQEGTREDMMAAKGKVFVIAGEEDEQYAPLIRWLDMVEAAKKCISPETFKT